MTHSSASASEMMASSAAPAPSSVYQTISFRRRSPLECPPPAVDVSSVSEQSERTLTALDATSLPHQASPCPTYTLMTLNALLIFRTLHRCYSCASMRHASMLFPIYNAHVPADLALLDSQTPLATPLSRDAPRAHTASQKFPVCVFCRRGLHVSTGAEIETALCILESAPPT